MRNLKRLLSFTLALLTLFFALSPSLAHPAQAVAAIDDAVLAVGLVFLTWAGVTLSTNADCYKVVSNFLSNSAAGLEACTNVATNYLTENGLALVTEVQDAYSAVLSDLRSTFQTPADSLSGSLSGSYSIGATYSVPSAEYNYSSSALASLATFPLSPDYQYAITITDNRGTNTFVNSTLNSSYFRRFTSTTNSNYQFWLGTDDISSFGLWTRVSKPSDLYFSYITPSGVSYSALSSTCTSVSITPIYASDSISFSKTKEIEDTEILEVTFAPGGVWEPSPDDPTDPSQPSQPLIPFLPFDPFQNPITWGQDASQGLQAPGLNPSTVLSDLKQLLEDFKNGSGIGSGGSGGSGGSPGSDTTGGDLAQKFDADWKGVFPFCVPFDLIDFLSILSASPQAPKFTWRFYVPKVVDYNIEIDLSPFDSVAEIVRTMELLAFCIGLILLTRNIIRG